MRSGSRRRSPWLLWLGLLFAFAQAATNVHAISHLGQDAGRSRDGAPVHAQCDLCLIGASIAGAAPAAEPPSALLPGVGDVPYAGPADTVLQSARALAYRSRAPPAAPR
jgi:hypothetical protein